MLKLKNYRHYVFYGFINSYIINLFLVYQYFSVRSLHGIKEVSSFMLYSWAEEKMSLLSNCFWWVLRTHHVFSFCFDTVTMPNILAWLLFLIRLILPVKVSIPQKRENEKTRGRQQSLFKIVLWLVVSERANVCSCLGKFVTVYIKENSCSC